MLVFLLGLTLFVSAFLLFWCQPMIAKMVLPSLGGSPSVWTTCVLFFQTALLTGYIYAHLIGKALRLHFQLLVHVLLMLAAIAFLPIEFGAGSDWAAMDRPVTSLLVRLITVAGIPFFIVSSTAPLLQNWLAQTKLEARRDPYFLYAASNAGSLLALVVFPAFLEPRTGVSLQTALWTAGYALLVLMVVASAVLVWKHSGGNSSILPAVDDSEDRPDLRRRLSWLAAAFVPSALMLAVTNHISVNLAAAPFLWILPLAIYLLTFILAFSKKMATSKLQLDRLSRWLPVVLLLLLPIIPDVSATTASLNWVLALGHLTVLLVGAYLCHTALAASRPDSRRLTEFYFVLALGGALGGLFAAIVAPKLFATVIEYPLLVAVLPLFRVAQAGFGDRSWRDFAFPGLLAVLFAGHWYVQRAMELDITDTYAVLIPDALFFLAVFLFRKHRIRFALGFAVLLIGYALTIPPLVENGERIYVTRNFFGVKKVLFDLDRNRRKLLHGDTLHGLESRDPARSGQPISYYHPSGPVGDMIRLLGESPGQHVGIVGLGTGTMAAYAGPHRRMTFFDIDPQVASIARGFFTFIRRCGENCEVVVGDGRLAIERTPDQSFDLLMLDAFSSDSIPAHLVSREALRIYLSKLKPEGAILFHVSNRYLRVQDLVSALALDAGLCAYVRNDEDESAYGKLSSDYVIAARSCSHLGLIASNEGWYEVSSSEVKPWTDDYSNLLGILRLR